MVCGVFRNGMEEVDEERGMNWKNLGLNGFNFY